MLRAMVWMFKGCGVDVKGYAVDVKGHCVDVKGKVGAYVGSRKNTLTIR